MFRLSSQVNPYEGYEDDELHSNDDLANVVDLDDDDTVEDQGFDDMMDRLLNYTPPISDEDLEDDEDEVDEDLDEDTSDDDYQEDLIDGYYDTEDDDEDDEDEEDDIADSQGRGDTVAIYDMDDDAFESLFPGPNLYELIALESRLYTMKEKRTDKRYTSHINSALSRVRKKLKKIKNLKDLDILQRALTKEKNKYNKVLENMKNLAISKNDQSITKEEFRVGMKKNIAELDQQLTILKVKDFTPRGAAAEVNSRDLEAFRSFISQADALIAARHDYISNMEIDKKSKKDQRTSKKEEASDPTGEDDDNDDEEGYESLVASMEACNRKKACKESLEDDDEDNDDDLMSDYSEDDPFIEAAYQSYLKAADELRGEVAQETRGEKEKMTPRKKPLTKKEYFLAMCKAKKIKDKDARRKTIDGIKSGNYTPDDAVDSGLLLKNKNKSKANEAVMRDGVRVMTADDDPNGKRRRKKKRKKATESFVDFMDEFMIDMDPATESITTSEASRRLKTIYSQFTMLNASKAKKTPSEVASNASDIIKLLDTLINEANAIEDPSEKSEIISKAKNIRSKLKSLAGRSYVKAAKEMFSEIDDDDQDTAIEEFTSYDDDDAAEESIGAKKDTYWTTKADSILQKITNRINHADKVADKSEAINILQGAKADAEDMNDHLDSLDMEAYRKMTSGSEEKKSSFNEFRTSKRKEVDAILKTIDRKLAKLQKKDTHATESLDAEFERFLQAFDMDANS